MFARNLLLVAIAALVGYNSVEALQPTVSDRRNFVGKLVAAATGAAVVATTTSGGAAWAEEPTAAVVSGYSRNARKSYSSREGSDLNEAQDTTTASLLGKM